MDNLQLFIGGKRYSGFNKVAISRGMESGVWNFELGVSPDLSSERYFAVKQGMSCQIKVGKELLLTGYVDEVPVKYSASEYEISAIGRSKTGDLVDCSSAAKQYAKDLSLLDILSEECKPYGISVEADPWHTAIANTTFATAQTRDAGQPVWEFIEKLARQRAVMLMPNAKGGLTITRLGLQRAQTSLILGKNIKACQAKCSARSLFSEYQFAGLQQFVMPDTPVQSDAVYRCEDIGRFRPCFTTVTGSVDTALCLKQAQWKRSVNYGRANSLVYTVQGWRQRPNGLFWQPNELVVIHDKRNDLNAKLFLISEARLMLTQEKGFETQLTVMPPEAFDVQQTADKALGFNR